MSKYVRIYGIDTSMTSTGIVCFKTYLSGIPTQFTNDLEPNVVELIESKPKKTETQLERFESLTERIIDVLTVNRTKKIGIVFIEGYAFGIRKQNSLVYRGELGGIFKYKLMKAGAKFFEIPPTSIKKFVAGKGNVKKQVIIKEVYKRWKFDTEDDNKADAFAIAKMGQILYAIRKGMSRQEVKDFLPQYQFQAVSKLEFVKGWWGK